MKVIDVAADQLVGRATLVSRPAGGRMRASVRKRVPPEERQRRVVRLAKPFGIQAGQLAGAVEPTQRAIDDQAEFLIAPCERERDRLERELTIENHELPRRRVASGRLEENGAFTEERAGITFD